MLSNSKSKSKPRIRKTTSFCVPGTDSVKVDLHPDNTPDTAVEVKGHSFESSTITLEPQDLVNSSAIATSGVVTTAINHFSDTNDLGAFQQRRLSADSSMEEVITDRPSAHIVYSIIATTVCFPLGAFALYWSLQCRRATRKGNLEQAVEHSRFAIQFGNLAISTALLFYVLLFVGRMRDLIK